MKKTLQVETLVVDSFHTMASGGWHGTNDGIQNVTMSCHNSNYVDCPDNTSMVSCVCVTDP